MSIIRKAKISADKRSVDAYGRSIELAIAGYLMDTGDFPTSISQLTIEYSGDEVVCTTTQIKSDSSVYLAGCTVGGRSVDGYTYGKEEASPTYTAYEVGDEVIYNNVAYRVIKASGVDESTVTLLKADPLTVEEINEYGIGHVNRYTSKSIGTASNVKGYGGTAYYSSETCGYVNGSRVSTDCTTDYAQSDVKYVVDAWKIAQAPQATEAKLISYEELTTDLGCSSTSCASSPNSWVYNSNYWYLTSSTYDNSSEDVFYIDNDGRLDDISVYKEDFVVRPVITISKSYLN